MDVGTALIVERIYREGQLASGESVTLDCVRKAKKRWLVKAARISKVHVLTHILREDNWRRGEIQLRGVEWLSQEIRRIQLVEDSGSGCLGHLRLLRLAAHLHASHALGDASDASGRPLTSRRLVSLIRSLVAAIGGLRCRDGLLPAITSLGILISRSRRATGDWLRLGLGV